MTVIIDTPVAAERHPHPITGRTRWLAATLFLLGGAFQLTEFLLEPAFASSRERVQWWLANPTQLELSQAFGVLAIPCMLGTFYFGYRLVRDQSRRIAAAALGMLVCAMVGLAAIHGVEMSAHWAAQQGRVDAAVGILDVTDIGISGVTTFVMFLPAAVLGNLLFAVAMWRSRHVPRLVVALVLAFALLDFGGGLGVASHASGLAADAVLAWAVVTGYVRISRAERAARAH